MNRKTLAGFGTAVGTPSTYDSTIAYSYDAGNRLSSVVDSVTGTIKPTYDKLDRLISEQTSQGVVSYTYDAAGRRTQMTVAGQAGVNYAYDNANRLLQITQGSSTVSFGYDSGNRRTSLTLPNGIVMTFSYDNGSELTGITYTNGGTTLGTLTYAYDLAGRRTQMGGSYAQIGLPLAISEAEYNANNQLTEWGTASLYYDPNGNMTSDGVNSLVWNTRNQLASMNFGANTFQYDAYGRRTSKTISSTTTNLLYDEANIAQELTGTTPTANFLTGGIDEVFTRTDSSGTANFLTAALGSTLALTNSSGSALAQYAYDPFGNTTVTSGSSANSYEYTGRENDGTGLYFYRARYYSAVLQRFISEDSIGYSAGVNFYTYVSNAPTNFADPLGEDKNSLINAQNSAVGNPAYQPKGGVTHCNQATLCIIQTVGAPTGGLTDNNGGALTANEMATNLANNGGYVPITPQQAQTIANSGGLVIATWANPDGSGHVATVRPAGIPEDDPPANGRGPLINNIGKDNAVMNENWVFPKGANVIYYTPTTPSTAGRK